MKKILSELRFYSFQLKQNFRNKKVLRTSFFLQIIGMILNNTSFFIIWIMFSKTIGPVNGWGAFQTFGMLSVSILIYGIVHTCFGSVGTLADRVPSGAFDTYLTKPKSLYVRILNNTFSVSALGDLIQGILGLAIFLCLSKTSFETLAIILLLLPSAVIVHIAFHMTCDCIIFWMPQGQNLGRALFDLIMLPTTQPISMLKGGMRFFYLFIIPALVVAGLPIEAFMHTSWKIVFLSYGIAISWFIISYWTLDFSLKRYESGNSIGS